MSGFNLPPGCSVSDIERAMGIGDTCEVCHGIIEDEGNPCTCDECPECGSVGDPECYTGGECNGLHRDRPRDHGENCLECHPPKGTCPQHGEYLMQDGCVACELEAYEADQAGFDQWLEQQGAEEGREMTNAEMAHSDFLADCARERDAFGR